MIAITSYKMFYSFWIPSLQLKTPIYSACTHLRGNFDDKISQFTKNSGCFISYVSAASQKSGSILLPLPAAGSSGHDQHVYCSEWICCSTFLLRQDIPIEGVLVSLLLHWGDSSKMFPYQLPLILYWVVWVEIVLRASWISSLYPIDYHQNTFP